jgi:hypothetical protein
MHFSIAYVPKHSNSGLPGELPQQVFRLVSRAGAVSIASPAEVLCQCRTPRSIGLCRTLLQARFTADVKTLRESSVQLHEDLAKEGKPGNRPREGEN